MTDQATTLRELQAATGLRVVPSPKKGHEVWDFSVSTEKPIHWSRQLPEAIGFLEGVAHEREAAKARKNARYAAPAGEGGDG